jgi:hypothetical protein
MRWIFQNPEREIKAWRIVACALAVAIVAISLAWYNIAAARENAVQQQKERMERQLAQSMAELERERTRNREIAKINLEAFLYDYNNLLEEVRQAIADYEAAKRLPPSDRDPSVASSKRRLYTKVNAFVTFITRWRSVAETLNELLDGNVIRMEQARQNDNTDDVEGATVTLTRTFPGLREQFQIKINILKSQ